MASSLLDCFLALSNSFVASFLSPTLRWMAHQEML
ncbi:hypothetical protein SLEP1_g32256 [Rubroshorea leprosula]|uniref:Uncharacterized protein n=1 Tax=Rubroshorea leprosula TaxID=152421 RepID=A0AAV5KCS0_9ROSI|nr:hypothetical protein SLEP1_g32256 [Rubroshorea leprosula]